MYIDYPGGHLAKDLVDSEGAVGHDDGTGGAVPGGN